MTGGYVARQKGSWASNSDFDKSSINVRLDYQLTPKTKIWGSFAYNDYFSQTGGNIDSTGYYSRSYQSPADFTYRSSFSSRSRLTLEHKWSDNANSSLTAFYRDNALGQNPSYSISWTSPALTASGQVNKNSFKSFGLMGQHTQNLEFLNSKLVAGFLLDRSPNDYWAYKINLAATLRSDKKSVEKFTITQVLPTTFLGNYSAVIWNKAAYAQFDLHPAEKWRLSLGGRFDQMSFDYTNFMDNSTGTKSYEQFSPKLGVTYEASSSLGFYGNFSKGFSPPALSAVFRARPAAQAAATGEKFYLSIDPAVFSNYEVGGWASLWQNKVFFDYTFYRLEGNNELLGIRQPDNTTDYQSAGKTLHEGIEYQITIRPNDSWNFRFGGTNAKHTFVDFVLSTRASDALKNVNGKEMPQAPNFIANSEVTYKYKGARIALEWQKIGPWFQDQVNNVSFEGLSVFNLRMGYNYKAYQFFTNIMNLGDALYATTATRGNNATDKSTYTPAAPRTVVAGVQIDVFQLFKNEKLLLSLVFFAQISFAQTVSNPANQALDPSFALKSNGDVVLSWVEKSANGVLFFRKVNQGPAEQVPIDKKASTHAEGMPKLAYKADGTCILLYEMNRPTAASRFNGDLLYAMEVNGVWQKPQYIHQDTAAGLSHSFGKSFPCPMAR